MKKLLYIFLSKIFLVISIVCIIIFIFNTMIYLIWIYKQQPSLIRGVWAILTAFNPYDYKLFMSVILVIAPAAITYMVHRYFEERIDK